ncbi:hypothetical protein B0H14DRAFT_748812 [Mycena olivaceomarginata]|nr:hypothetical protein B0H14DRAFT_748812 [Mycena olivaceomarginata]
MNWVCSSSRTVASSRDARSIQIFNDYALKYGRSWYEWINGVLRRKVGNGGLYLVTGVTKSTSWCVVAGKNSSSDRTVSLKLKAPPVGVAAASYTWELENTSFCVPIPAHTGCLAKNLGETTRQCSSGGVKSCCHLSRRPRRCCRLVKSVGTYRKS